MKKIAYLLALLLALTLAACGGTAPQEEDSGPKKPGKPGSEASAQAEEEEVREEGSARKEPPEDLSGTPLAPEGWEEPEETPSPLEITGFQGDLLLAVYRNDSGEPISYGEHYTIEGREGREWTSLVELAFHDIAYDLPAGESVELTFDLAPFGELEEGDYRLVFEGHTAEFQVTETASGELTGYTIPGKD